MTTNDPKEALESIIDYSGLFLTLEMIEVICQEKADELRANWQDEHLSNNWLEAAKAIGEFKMLKQIILA